MRNLRAEVEYTVWVLVLSLVLATFVIVFIDGCGSHRQITTAQSQAPEPALDGQAVGPESSRLTFRTTSETARGVLAPVYFDFDRHDVRPDQRPALAATADGISPGALMVLEGHADERGTDAYNLALGLRRAYAVRNYLRDLGVLAEFECVTFGEERPADPGHDEAAWAKNRRVEFATR